MNYGQLFSGLALIIFGFVLVIIPLAVGDKVGYGGIIFGAPIIILGFYILFNKNEDKIEVIRK